MSRWGFGLGTCVGHFLLLAVYARGQAAVRFGDDDVLPLVGSDQHLQF
jgi:hypothetical protein